MNNDAETSVLNALNEAGIEYRLYTHKPVHTLADAAALDCLTEGTIAKNLFLRDARGNRHFLLVLAGNKQANLKELRKQLGSSALSLASEERLQRLLGLKRGEVTPLGILNDEKCTVEVLFDQALRGVPSLGVHPNHNVATVFLAFSDLESLIRRHGNPVSFVDIETTPSDNA